MKNIFFITAIIVVKLSFSQAPGIEWQNTIGGSKSDYLSIAQQTSDGGFILGGWSESGISGDKTEANILISQDYWIVKLDSSGNIQWQNTIGGSSDDKLICVQQTLDDGFILGGTSYSGISGDKTEAEINPGYSDIWIIKLDNSGNIIWQNTIGGNVDDLLTAMEQTSDGGYILGAYSDSGISGDKTEAAIGGGDYWIIKLDDSGDIVWQNTIGGNAYDALNAIQQTTDGGYILGGSSYSGISGDKTEAVMGIMDYWVIKLDDTGNIVWQNTIGGSSGDGLWSIIQTSDGGYFLGGASSSSISGDKTESSHGLDDYWVLKLDAVGNIVWQNTIGGDRNDDLYCAQQTVDGGFILGGKSFSGISGDKTEVNFGISSTCDYWIVKLNNSGNVVWQNDIGGNKNDIFRNIQQTVDGGFLVAGYSNSNLSGDKTESFIGANSNNDYWVLKIAPDITECSAPTGLSSDNITSTSVKVHWTSVPTADSYKIYYRVSGDVAWAKKTATSNFKNLPGLIPSTTYEWKVKSSCSGETTDFSSIQTFTTLPMKEGELNTSSLITFYPNPANDKLNITLNSNFNLPSSLHISISDLSGQVISQQFIKSDKTEIDISDYTAGIYFVKVIVGENEFVQKLIIE